MFADSHARRSEAIPQTSLEYQQAILRLICGLIPPGDQNTWMLTPQPALNGDWPSLALQKGNEEAVYQLLLRLKQGN